MTEAVPLWLLPVFFAVALAYATVGLGGGTSYAAALAVIGLPHTAIPQLSLACNVLVTAGGVWNFRRAGHVAWGQCLPFVVGSVPAAYLGGRVSVGPRPFAILLGCSLLAAAVRMLGTLPARESGTMGGWRWWGVGVPVGAALGFLSGLVGIGGGVFLASLLVLTGWNDARAAAGVVTVFTLANSLAGLAGHAHRGLVLGTWALPLILSAVVGGQIGSRLGARHLPTARLREVLAALLLFFASRMLWQALGP